MLLEAVVVAFALTQMGYFVANCGLLTLFVRRPADEVDESTLARIVAAAETEREGRLRRVEADGGQTTAAGPAVTDAHRVDPQSTNAECRLPQSSVRRIRVLVPIYRERWATLSETLENIAAQRYPTEYVSVVVIYEPTDRTVAELRDGFAAGRTDALSVEFVAVDHDALAADRSPGEWSFDGVGVPRTKAAALTYAFTTGSFAGDDVVTVFDSDTQVPRDTFELAVAGLAEYDIVQAKQTVRNVDEGLLPLLESMGIAAWSDIVYANSTDGPYQLLGKAYFAEARVLYDLDRWQLDAATEDMALGVAAHRQGYTLGVIDRYVQDLCPTAFDAWVRQKRRWVRGPYRHLFTPDWSGFERGRFWAGTVLTQLLSVTNVVGVPIGVVILALTVLGTAGTVVPVFLLPVVLFNAAVWAYYSWRSYRAAWDGVVFESRRERVGYSLRSNPFAQAVYATLWAIPIALAVADVVRGVAPTFTVTPKR
ncbi:glycosyltransferase family 2 protein [Natrinema sp. 1APR25-10V2]|uniref:glycosyltransferase family 2 protein n=1 Tax=Natrinema sp. 1APR25-10V2 TaxID=2951081 RepID=UPI00287561C0|nr:glycosyltransferase family 2 protein [Natrinema sp. 1APR25-10V2]MDS0475015.1 glycosyltransferase [Natrinema sp. 1APR25-10V2]